MVGVIVEEIQCSIALVEKNLQAVENNLVLAKSCQKEKMFATTKACNQMEDCNNNPIELQQRLETLQVGR
jgi:hypothetical protein